MRNESLWPTGNTPGQARCDRAQLAHNDDELAPVSYSDAVWSMIRASDPSAVVLDGWLLLARAIHATGELCRHSFKPPGQLAEVGGLLVADYQQLSHMSGRGRAR